ncbi:nuclear transport factor 2 family protein [Pelobacter seleniigenes]|uniref:nuclear transport factor 2 family protein n=1 Tax=Pelobacter seleniigenes TaxID=407188 RepID=UPI0004A71B67|nr:nuclear transport factor 2 family protein [Pelobacter seleniigenes]
MSFDLPEPIDSYFSASRAAGAAIARCFTEHAMVKDEGHTYNGRVAIEQWEMAVAEKFTYTSTPFACAEQDGKIIVTSRVIGNFPGSPVDLRYFFCLEGDKIASLEIIL